MHSFDLGKTAAYRYDLPPELIATTPAQPPDAARLLVPGGGGALEHKTFVDLPQLLRSGDVLVVNETRVIRARLRGRRVPGGGAAELLLLGPASGGRYDPSVRQWRALARPGRKLRTGDVIRFADVGHATVVARHDDGTRDVAFDIRCGFEELLETFGHVPLPPYVGSGSAERAARYQTMFARVPGSVAAPTASLHFTAATFAALRERGVVVVPLVLDVGLATFKPVTAERLDDHVMHAEWFDVPQATAEALRVARGAGGRVVAAGTTVLRALESAVAPDGTIAAFCGRTDLFIAPGYHFRAVDGLLTNFHLPASTLLVLVSAFAGYERTMAAYAAAIDARYRFYSFGDAMFVWRSTSRL